MSTTRLRHLFLTLFMLAVLCAGRPVLAQTEVTYCIDPNWPPYEAYRKQKHVGISAQYLDIISRYTDLTFTLVPTTDWEQSLNYVQTGKCMMLAMLNVSSSRSQFLAYSEPYFEAPNVLVSGAGEPMLHSYEGIGERTVGVVRGYRIASYINQYYPDIQTRSFPSELDALSAVAQGEIDVMVGSLLSVNYHISKQQFTNLKVVGYAEPYDSLRFGVNQAYADELIPVLDEAIEAIPEAQHVKIFRQWNTVQVRESLLIWPYVVLAASIALALTCMIWRGRLKRQHDTIVSGKQKEIDSLKTVLLDKNRTLEFLSSHDPLTGLYNRNQMIQRAEEEVSRYQRFQTPASLIIIELDSEEQYSNVRDLDDILKSVSRLCLTAVREVDVVSRFGGQQFVIMCPQTDVGAAMTLSERMIESIADTIHKSHVSMKVVAAVSDITSGEGFSEWYDRTVKALYQARRFGYGKTYRAD